jgi:MoaA/NifB/PqqE/SkfB family radical SAM enzyme
MKGIPELDTQHAMKIVDDIGRSGTWMISFNGGEPLLRPDIFKLIKHAKQRGMIVDINTNGWLLKRAANQLIENGVDTITVSVESETSAYHDEIRQTPGLFKRLTEGIEEVKKIRGNNKTPIIKVRAALSKDNIQKIHNYIEHWKTLVDEVVLQPIHECNKNFFVAPEKMKFNKKDEKDFMVSWRKLTLRYPWLKTSAYAEFPTFFFNKKTAP